MGSAPALALALRRDRAATGSVTAISLRRTAPLTTLSPSPISFRCAASLWTLARRAVSI